MAKYLQIFMIWTTLSVYMLIVPGSTGSASQIKTLSYDCKSDGSMVITVPNNYSLQNIDSSPCINSTTGQGSDQYVLKNCTNRNQTIALKHNSLLGGKMPIFSLKCVDSKYTIQLNATALPINPNPTLTTMSPHTISHKETITMMIKNDHGGIASTAVIGDKLSLVISAPHNLKIAPLECYAVSGDDDYPIWSASSSPQCNVEDSVIESNWKTSSNDSQTEYSIVMYAFRLVNSNSLTISCTVDVCPNSVGGCSQMCVTGTNPSGSKKRKRRNAAIGNREKVNRHLETNLRVYDSVEDKIQASGASVLTTSYVAVFCALVSTLYHSQL